MIGKEEEEELALTLDHDIEADSNSNNRNKKIKKQIFIEKETSASRKREAKQWSTCNKCKCHRKESEGLSDQQQQQMPLKCCCSSGGDYLLMLRELMIKQCSLFTAFADLECSPPSPFQDKTTLSNRTSNHLSSVCKLLIITSSFCAYNRC